MTDGTTDAGRMTRETVVAALVHARNGSPEARREAVEHLAAHLDAIERELAATMAMLGAVKREAEAALAAHAETRAIARGVLSELRCRFHAGGRRPETCHEMSLVDAALAAIGKGAA